VVKIVIDRRECVGSGMCTSIAPDVFELDDEGTLVVLHEEVSGAQVPQVEDAAACCPVEAIALVHEQPC
jgi:ferredoxin